MNEYRVAVVKANETQPSLYLICEDAGAATALAKLIRDTGMVQVPRGWSIQGATYDYHPASDAWVESRPKPQEWIRFD